MFIKNIQQFNSDEKILSFHHLVDLIKKHYELELQETDLAYSKIKTDEYEHLGRFVSDLYFYFSSDISVQCIKHNVIIINKEEFWKYYFKELDIFKDKTNELFNRYYPPTS